MKKEKEQEQAINLRLKGMSLLNIANTLGVSKGSVSTWVREIPIPENFTNTYRTSRRIKREEIADKIRQEKIKHREYLKEHVYEHIKQVSNTGKPLFEDIRLLSGDQRWMVPVPLDYVGKSYIKNLYVYEHRLVMELHICRLLEENEVVHHINENKLDNRLENLTLMSITRHVIRHSKPAIPLILICAFCGKPFKRYKSKYKKDRKNNFCCLSHANYFQQKERRIKKMNRDVASDG